MGYSIASKLKGLDVLHLQAKAAFTVDTLLQRVPLPIPTPEKYSLLDAVYPISHPQRSHLDNFLCYFTKMTCLSLSDS